MSEADAMPIDDIPLEPVAEPLAPPQPTVDQLHRLALPLEPDDRLRLVTRLWKSLPYSHRSAFLTLQLEQRHDDPYNNFYAPPQTAIDPLWPKINKVLFDRSNISELYSAPRRFDLATIFVVTAAYSLLLGALTALGAPPVVKVVLSLLVAIIATTQALFLPIANPRGVSILTGAAAYTVISIVLWFSFRGIFANSFVLAFFINGIVGGAILGYLIGTVVGGVFLVAEKLRHRFERTTNHDDQTLPATDDTSNTQ